MSTSAKLPQVYIDQATAAVFTLAGAVVGLIQGAIAMLVVHYPEVATKLKLDKVIATPEKSSAPPSTVATPEGKGSRSTPEVAASAGPGAKAERHVEEAAAPVPPSPVKTTSDKPEPQTTVAGISTPKNVEKEPTSGSTGAPDKADLVEVGKVPQAVRTPELSSNAVYKGSKKSKSRNGGHKK